MNLTERLNAKVRRAGLRVKSAVSEPEVSRFESAAGVSIPTDYREFLIQESTGAQIPYRLLSLDQWDLSYWLDDPKPSMIAEPCIVTPDAADHGEQWIDKAGVTDWERRWDDNEWNPMSGTIAIVEIGCGLCFSLIMTGPYRGRVFSWGDHALNPPNMVPQS